MTARYRVERTQWDFAGNAIAPTIVYRTDNLDRAKVVARKDYAQHPTGQTLVYDTTTGTLVYQMEETA